MTDVPIPPPAHPPPLPFPPAIPHSYRCLWFMLIPSPALIQTPLSPFIYVLSVSADHILGWVGGVKTDRLEAVSVSTPETKVACVGGFVVLKSVQKLNLLRRPSFWNLLN